jgi:hypothetical protein
MTSLFGDSKAIAKERQARKDAELEVLIEDETVEKEFELSVKYEVRLQGTATVKVRALSLSEAEGMVADDPDKFFDTGGSDCSEDDFEIIDINMENATPVDFPTIEDKTLSLFANRKSN